MSEKEENTKPCGCPKKHKEKKLTKNKIETSSLQTFDRIQWLKTRVNPRKLMDSTVKLKYLKHISEMAEYFATKKVFKRFDEDGNGTFFI